MDGALGLLLRLRLVGFLRRWGRSLRTMKGLLLALVGSLLYLPMLLTTVFAPRVQLTAQLAMIRRYGALGLFGFCVLNLILTSDERAVYFAPAEIEFLFSGPFRRRQLLLYKMVSGLFSSVLVALLMTFFFAHHARSFLPAFVGLFLMIEQLVLLSMAFGLFVSTVGALAFSRQRRIVLGAVARGRRRRAAAPGSRPVFRRRDGAARPARKFAGPPGRGLALPPPGDGLHGGASLARAGRLVASGPGRAGGTGDRRRWRWTPSTTKPPRPPARGSTTRLALGCRDGRRRGRYRTPIQLPMLPWWGGVGPALWRQLATAVRFPGRFFMLLLLHL